MAVTPGGFDFNLNQQLNSRINDDGKTPPALDGVAKVLLGVSLKGPESSPFALQPAAPLKMEGNATAQRILGVIPTAHQTGLSGAILASILKCVTGDIQDGTAGITGGEPIGEGNMGTFSPTTVSDGTVPSGSMTLE